MPLVKPLCRVCERPTADGAVQAVQMDKEKLQTWFLNVCGDELADEIEDEDLICNFCIWHAEFLSKYVREFEALAWWPPDQLYLDDVAKELRRNYLGGKAEQCWVQLEKIELPKIETEENGVNEENSEGGKSGRKCFYCRKMVANIRSHMRYMHENVIKCEYRRCATFFHTVEEKDIHTKEVHEKKLNFCEKLFRRSDFIRNHIRRFHSEFGVRCKFFGCLCYFKSESEMSAHFDSVHKEEDNAKVFNCYHCEFKSKYKVALSFHVSLHFPKSFKCKKCHKLFSTKKRLAEHVRKNHKFKVCSVCNSEIIVKVMRCHLKRKNCTRCNNEFECSGLYKSHWKTCRTTLFKCDKCPKAFKMLSLLEYHLKRKHRNNSWRGLQYKNLGFKCEPCRRYYKNETLLKLHLNHFHKKLNLKHCAHCPKSFTNVLRLKNHLAMTHNLIERKFECGECQKKFVSSSFLASHKRRTHLLSKNLKSCKVCGKSMGANWLKTHLLAIHGMESA